MAQKNKDFFQVFGLLSIILLVKKGDAYEYKVGGSKGWTVPTDPNASIYNQWAEKSRFQIHDTLLFVYPAGQDSVLHVTKDDYANCNTGSPLDKFTDGHTVYKFDQSGPHYFISGVPEHCHKNEKLLVVVMADRSHPNSNATVASPPPSPPPSPAPAGEEPPSPPSPAGEESPSPPSPAPSEESSPPSPSAPVPSEESSPPKNGGSSVVATSVIGTVAVFVGSCFF